MIHVTLTFYKFSHTYSFVEIYYDKVEEYFNFEPSLQTLFVYVAPKSEFSALCKRVPPHLVTELLVKYSLRPIEQKVHLLLKLRCVIILL